MVKFNTSNLTPMSSILVPVARIRRLFILERTLIGTRCALHLSLFRWGSRDLPVGIHAAVIHFDGRHATTPAGFKYTVLRHEGCFLISEVRRNSGVLVGV